MFYLNDSENTTCQNFQNAVKAEMRWKLMALNVQMGKKERPEISGISLPPEDRGGNQNKLKLNIKKKITKIRGNSHEILKRHRKEK